MSIKLDWEVEAEQSHISTAGEDPEMLRRRRRARRRLLIVVLGMLTIIGLVAAVVIGRLREVDAQIEQNLRDTVEAEVAALRIGDRTAFMGVQRSASEVWLAGQEGVFNEYQILKQERDVQLTGRVVDMAVDGMRGRVKIEEIIDGVPYGRLWFYWRYEDGWRHVPADPLFWGEPAALEGQQVTVRYREVDAALAEAVAARLEDWIAFGCAALMCSEVPPVTVDIIPDGLLQPGWAGDRSWALQLSSPFTGRARLDVPFDLDLQLTVANLLIDRLIPQVSGVQPVYPADAVFLRQSVASWLAGRFTDVQTNAYLIDSLAQTYGEGAVGRLLQVLSADANISVVNSAAGTASLEQTNLDWRDFLTWRLTLENELIAARDEANFLNLYDTRDETTRNLAYGRFNAGQPAQPVQVVSFLQEADANGVPQLRALAQIGEGDGSRQEEVIFRLIDGVWRRAN